MTSADDGIYSKPGLYKARRKLKWGIEITGRSWGQGECAVLDSKFKNVNRDYD